MPNPPEPARRIFTDPINDSSRWNAYVPRDGDIVVSTPPKAGTTWTQAILALLISGDPETDAQPSIKAPWIDINRRDISEVIDRLSAQTHRRQVKTHTPFDCIPYWAELRYITVYRHPIDVHFSFKAHKANMKEDLALGSASDDPSEQFRAFLHDDQSHAGFSTIVDHYRCTLAREPRDNLLRLHYADMLRDPRAAFDRIAAHVGISHPPTLMDDLFHAASFTNMKANAARFAPGGGQDFWRSDAGFFHSASSNKWEGILTGDDLAEYDRAISEVLTPEERAWLEWGSVA